MTTEERLARLEETMFFQERLLHELNEALTGQQRQLDAMTRTQEMLSTHMEELRQTMTTGEAPVNAPPPHYQER